MGDKIAIFDVGELVQYGSPQEILHDPANDFVKEFIGADRTLKELQITPVRDIMSEQIPAAEQTATRSINDTEVNSTAALADGTGGQYVTPTDTVDIALSRMIEVDTKSLPVVKDDDVVGVVTESAIRAHQSNGEV